MRTQQAESTTGFLSEEEDDSVPTLPNSKPTRRIQGTEHGAFGAHDLNMSQLERTQRELGRGAADLQTRGAQLLLQANLRQSKPYTGRSAAGVSAGADRLSECHGEVLTDHPESCGAP